MSSVGTNRRGLVTLAALALGAGCPSGSTSPTGVGGGGAVSVATHSVIASPSSSSSGTSGIDSSSTAAGSGGAGACPMEPPPPGVPPGWVEYTDWSCKCRFYVPDSPAAMPAPIQWQKCPTSPNGVDCQTMAIDWTTDQRAVDFDAMMTTTNGPPVLGIQRRGLDAPQPFLLKVIADADGLVHFAMLKMWTGGQLESSPGCILIQHSLNEGKFIYSILGDDAKGKWTKSGHKGALGGSIDDLHPKVLASYYDSLEHDWSASSTRIYRYNFSELAYPWDMKTSTVVAAAGSDPNGLQMGAQPLAVGDNFFWMSDSSYTAAIDSWNPVDGRRSLVRYSGDLTRAAGNLGTDGTTLVWTYGEGKKPNESTNLFPTRSIMASPFTTDAAKLTPKRLRSDPVLGIGLQFQVGCGRAAHGGSSQPVVVVSLKDGMSWLLPKESPPDYDPLIVLGLTCEHVYLYGEFGGRFTIARIKLSSLGPGIPAD